MRHDLERPISAVRPLVGEVEKPGAIPQDTGRERDEDIISTLRRKLSERNLGDTSGSQPRRKGPAGEEDKYEPQRLSRKICWQYDATAKKVPLLRRHYI